MRKTYLLIALMMMFLGISARNYELYGDNYFAYPELSGVTTVPTNGYEPFYISMFTRHGSHWRHITSNDVNPLSYRLNEVKGMVHDNSLRVAFIADAHIQDLITHPQLMRTMESEVHSTRLFNENIFAFKAALNDVARRGIRLVVLPGDITDNGQKANICAVRDILDKFAHDYGMRFFVTTGNHDPSRPFGEDAVSDDYLDRDGSRLFIASRKELLPAGCKGLTDSLTHCCGYREIMNEYKNFGFSPQSSYLYWATPFSTYNYEEYTEAKARKAALPENRLYNICDSLKAQDASYVVEPERGLWLLSVDGSVYMPKNIKNGKYEYAGSQLGYNNVEKNKPFLLSWIAKVASDARRLGKTLVTFCHYPAADFSSGAAPMLAEWWGRDRFNIPRAPSETFSKELARAGVTLHFAGHIHVNNTAVVTDGESGNKMYNIQIPSTALCVPAYKILTVRGNGVLQINTVVLDSVPGFDQLYGRYRQEWNYETTNKGRPCWNPELMKARSYPEFCDLHFRNLLKVRLIPAEMPAVVRDSLMKMSGSELMSLSGCSLHCETAVKDTTGWTGDDFVTDLYRFMYAGSLARRNVPESRLSCYVKMILAAGKMPEQPENSLKENLRRLCLVFKCFLNACPDNDFEIDTDN